MSMQSSMANFISSIKNSFLSNKKNVIVLYSKINISILKVIKSEGYILDFVICSVNDKKHINIELKYYNNISVINNIKIVSKSSRRVYIKNKNITSVSGGFGLSILSTSMGIMSNIQAKDVRVGGEILLEIN